MIARLAAAAALLIASAAHAQAIDPVARGMAGQALDMLNGNTPTACATITTSRPCFNITGTWNNAAVNFPGALSVNITNTASGASSLLLDLKASTVSQFSVGKAGVVTAAGAFSGGSTITGAGNISATTGGLRALSNAGTISIGATPDVILARDAASYLAQRNGTTAQGLRVYKTYTDGSNYERGVFDFATTTNWLSIGAEAAGSGTARPVLFTLGSSLWAYGGTTSSFPALKRSSTALQFRLADDSGYAPTRANGYSMNSGSVINDASDGTVRLSNAAVSDFGLLQLGGTTSSFPALKRSTTTIQFRLADDSAYAATRANGYSMNSGSVINDTADGSVRLSNAAVADFGLLQLGGTTSSFPALKRSGAGLVARLADDSANANLTALGITGTTFTGGTFSGTTVTANQVTASGSTSAQAVTTPNIVEAITVSATAATGTINYDVTTQSIIYYTTNASANWTINLRASSGTSMNTMLSTGQAITVAHLVKQGGTAYYNNVVQVDGTTSGVTTVWQGGAPSAGTVSSVDAYTYTVVKTGSATFTVFATKAAFS